MASRKTAGIFLALFLAAAPAAFGQYDVPYVPTDYAVIDSMLSIAKVTSDDVLYDLGCGDGRIVIQAVRQRGVKKAVGIDIDPFRIRDSNANAQKEGLTGRVEFREQNIFEADYLDATVITMYLLDTINLRLRPIFFETLKPGTRIVSHDFNMDDWIPDRKMNVAGRDGWAGHVVSFWILPANISGIWTFTAGGLPHTLLVNQIYQDVQGTVVANGTAHEAEDMEITGDRVHFSVPANGTVYMYDGIAAGDTITGTIESGGTSTEWKASRDHSTIKTIITIAPEEEYTGS